LSRSNLACGNNLFPSRKDFATFNLEATDKFAVLATNRLGSLCLATPAASDGTLFFRTTDKLLAIRAK
jgi:hypothetical protein